MKATKIYSDNLEAITTAIEAAEGRATARTLSPESVCEKLNRAEAMMNWPSKKALKGTRILVHASTEKLPNSYKYRAESTQALFEHDGKGWILVEVKRGTLRQSSDCSKRGLEIYASDEAKNHMLSAILFC